MRKAAREIERRRVSSQTEYRLPDSQRDQQVEKRREGGEQQYDRTADS
jgi:hypothetical protein